MRREESVVITGLGPVSSIGIDVDGYREGLRSGRLGTGPITSFDTTGFPRVNGGEVPNFQPAIILESLRVEDWGRSALFAAAAARLAYRDAGSPEVDPTMCSSVFGTTSGESQEIEAMVRWWVDHPRAPMEEADASRMLASGISSAVNTELGFGGEALTISTACSASNYAIGYAYDLLTEGRADLVVAGGADAVCRWAHAGFHRLGALAKQNCSPFDEHRGGVLIGEGGSALVMERSSSALERGARIYAEVRGYALSCDADHMVSPNREGIARCMRLALISSGTEADEISYICAHGTGTIVNDLIESLAIHDVFGEQPPATSSIKSMLGHTMGAASGFGAIASALALFEGFLPPTINHHNTDPAMGDLDVVPNNSRSANLTAVQNHGFGFGGNNAVVILGRYPK